MFQKIHTLQQSLEKKVSQEQSFIGRFFSVCALFFVFLIHAFAYSFSVLFFPSQKSFVHIHNTTITDASEENVARHHSWSKKVRWGSVASLVASIAITSALVSVFAGKLPTFAAGDCSLDINVEASPIDVDAYIASQSGCDNLTVTSGSGSGTATLQFTDSEVDIASGGIFTIDSGVTIVFSGALNFPTGSVVNDGMITHSNEDATGVSITAENILNNGTVDVSGKGCQPVSGGDGKAPNSTGACAQSEPGSGIGTTSNGGAGGAGHGSYGGNGQSKNGGMYYGDTINTNTLGASGGSMSAQLGGAGGGFVYFNATDEIENNGTISSNGGNASGGSLRGGGGGAGGSVFLSAADISSLGTIQATGGNGGGTTSTSTGGGGAAGHVAVHYTDSIDSYDASAFSLSGGNTGSGASPQAEKGLQGNAVVIDDVNNTYDIFSGFFWKTDLGSSETPVSSLIIDSGATMYCDEDVATIAIYADDIEWGGSLECDNSDSEDSSGSDADVTKKAKRMTNFSITANNNLEFLSGVQMDFSDEEMVFEVNSPENLTFDNATISGAREGMWNMDDDISISLENNTDINSNVYWFIDELNVDSTSTLNADEKGCQGTRLDSVFIEHDTLVQEDSFGPTDENVCVKPDDGGLGGVIWGTVGSFGADAAGHGGVGGTGSSSRGQEGQSYGSEMRPKLFGSGGGTAGSTTTGADRMAQGGHGGGLILVQADNSMNIAGRVSANGGGGENTGSVFGVDPDSASGGGSGGTVRLVTDNCENTGTITANGGTGGTDTTSQGGGGAGGRVRLAPVDSGSCENSLTNSAAAPGSAGGGSASAGDEGTGHSELLLPPTPFVTFPYPESYNVSINPTITVTPYDDNGGFKMSHSITVKEESGGTVWETGTIDTNDESGLALEVNTTNGTFADSAMTSLNKETRYCVTVTYTNLAGDGESPETCFQTVYQDDTLNAQVLYEWTFTDAVDYIFNGSFVDVASDLAQLLNLSAGASEPYTDVVIDAQNLRTKADFWYTISETLSGANGGSVRYQIGNDGDNDGTVDAWYYVDYSGFNSDYTSVPTWTETTADPTNANTTSAQDLNYYAPAWTTTASLTGSITIRAYLLSDGEGIEPTELDTTAVVVSNNDRDGDGYDSVASGGDDCNDDDATVNPGAAEVYYDGIDQNCDGLDDYDQDGDGYTPNEYEDQSPLPAGDCNDTDASVNPGAAEVYYDGVDQNCDGASDYDQDLDGYDTDLFGGNDCNDLDASVNPGAAEVYYDGVDQNCDGANDFDADEDTYISDAFGGDDCNDADYATHPGADDAIVDGIDLDCDGFDGPDADGDGYADSNAGGDDCNDADDSIFPGAVEIDDDGIDQNCDGVDGVGKDDDRDGSSDVAIGGTDCDDANPLVFPTANDNTRNAVDENCDGIDGPFVVERVTGTPSGRGIVTVYAPDDSIHYTYEAFAKGGVYPVLATYQNRYFVAEVKFGRGKVVRVHELKAPRFGGAQLLTTKRVSRTPKQRRLTMGEIGKKRDLHVVLSTTRGDVQIGQARQLKVLQVRPNRAQVLRPVKAQFYRIRKARTLIENNVSIEKRNIVVIRNNANKILFIWNPRVK